MMALVLMAAILMQAQLQPGVVIGQVTSRDGMPAAGVRVGALAAPETGQLVTSSSTIVGLTQTDNAGRYRIENVPPGRYYVIAGFVETPSYYPGVNSLNTATAINVTSANTVRGVDFVMVTGFGVTVKGRVSRPASQPTTGPQRILLSGSSTPLPDTTVNSDGTFEFQKVRPGSYNIFVSAGTLARPVTVVVADKDIDDVNVALVAMVPISGSLVVEGGGLRPRLTLNFIPFSGGSNPAGASILSNGSINTQIPEGEYRVAWSGLPAGYVPKSITSGSTDMLTNRLNAVATSPVAPVVVTLGVLSPPPWVKVSGKVTGISNASDIGPIRLSLTGTNTIGVDALDVPVKSDGSFEFPMVLPGSYTARITPLMPIPATTVLVANRDTSVEIALPAMRNVTGRVIVEGLGTLPRLNFALPAAGTGGVTSSVAAVTQPDGSFKVLLPEGERRITLNVPGYAVKSLTYGTTDLLHDPIKLSSADTDEIHVALTASTLTVITPNLINVGQGVGVVGGVVGGVPGGIVLGPPPPPPPPPAPPLSGSVPPQIITKVEPSYNDAARAARVQGEVVLSVIVTADGGVDGITVVSGDALLRQPAIDAVKQWRFRPGTVNGQPVAVRLSVTVNFRLY